MNILLVAATALEIQPFLQHFELEASSGNEFLVKSDKHQITILITGVGMVATTFQLTRILEHQQFEFVIQAGVAGSYDKKLQLGTVYWVASDRFGDLGAEDHHQYLDIFQLGLQEEHQYPFQQKAFKNPIEKFPFIPLIPPVNSITVNTVSGNSATIKLRQEHHQCQLETMEGAAFHYVCLMKQVPFLQIRSLSNYVEPRNRSSWKMSQAVLTLNKWLLSALV